MTLAMSGNAAIKPIEGLKVLDLTKVLAGPICTQALASLGAEVIKVETIGGGDETRFWPPVSHGVGAAFISVNSGKRSIVLDLKAPEAREIVLKLAADADVIIESFAPGVAAKLGVDHDTLTAGRQNVICCSISGWGQRGPKAAAPGYDAVLQAYSGMMSMNGEPSRQPVRLPGSPIDQVTGLYATQAILAALLQRGRTGKGARLEVSLLESAIKLLAPNLQAYWQSGSVPVRSGSGHPSVVPYEVFETADRPLLMAIANEKFWRLFCKVADREVWLDDPRFRTNPDRVKNRDELIPLVAGRMTSLTADAWTAKLDAAGIPASTLHSIADIADSPQAEALGIYRTMVHPDLGEIKAVCEPILYDGQRAISDRPPPILGQHGREILMNDLGYCEEMVTRLAAEGIVQLPPQTESGVTA